MGLREQAEADLREQTEADFGRQVRTERERRKWTQDELARRLTECGLKTHTSTIAKIESETRPRAVRLAEAVTIAHLFGVTVDTLLGHPGASVGDLAYVLRRLHDAAVDTHFQIAAWQAALHNASKQALTFEFDGHDAVVEQAGNVQAHLDVARFAALGLSKMLARIEGVMQ